MPPILSSISVTTQYTAPPSAPPKSPTHRSILFLVATMTAVMCSQALPAMGRTMVPRNASPRPDLLGAGEEEEGERRDRAWGLHS